MTWQPTLGAVPGKEGTRFCVWAPQARSIDVVFEGRGLPELAMQKQLDGTFVATCAAARAGDRYRYRVDGAGPFPDPASRFQPEGVHGPSEIVDPAPFEWSDDDWRGLDRDRLVTTAVRLPERYDV